MTSDDFGRERLCFCGTDFWSSWSIIFLLKGMLLTSLDSHLPMGTFKSRSSKSSNEGCVTSGANISTCQLQWFGQLFHVPASTTCWSAPHRKGLLCWATAPKEICHTLLMSWTITPFLVRHVSGGSSPCRSNASVWLSERYRTVQVSIISPPVTMQSLSQSCKSF